MEKIWITGATGLVGKNILEHCVKLRKNIIGTNKLQCNLLDINSVNTFLSSEKPNIVIHCAAKAGGIGANYKNNESFFYENVIINSNLIHACVEHKIPKVVCISSVSVFDTIDRYISEKDIHLGNPYPGDFGYGWSKRLIDIHRKCLDNDNTKITSIILSNTFGRFDNFSITTGHVIPSLLHKFYLAKTNNTDITIWGNGHAEREFIYIDDVCKIILDLIATEIYIPSLIVSSFNSTKISNIVDIIKNISDFKNQIIWSGNLQGQSFRKTDKTLFNKFFPKYMFYNIEYAIEETYEWMIQNYNEIRK